MFFRFSFCLPHGWKTSFHRKSMHESRAGGSHWTMCLLTVIVAIVFHCIISTLIISLFVFFFARRANDSGGRGIWSVVTPGENQLRTIKTYSLHFKKFARLIIFFMPRFYALLIFFMSRFHFFPSSTLIFQAGKEKLQQFRVEIRWLQNVNWAREFPFFVIPLTSWASALAFSLFYVDSFDDTFSDFFSTFFQLSLPFAAPL